MNCISIYNILINLISDPHTKKGGGIIKLSSNNFRRNTENPLPGLYRARVEYNKDDQQLGRVKVRIPQCHGLPGKDSSIDYKDLPWAYPCTPFNSGYDYGSFIVPEVGSYVWITFEAGNPNQPVYIGSMYAKGSSIYQPMGTVSDEDKLSKKYALSEGRWNRPAQQNEVPVGSYSSDSDFENSMYTLYKSPKGASIEIEEQDEKESLSIIDRLGQVLKFMSPVAKPYNSYNAYRRYNKRADAENQYDTEDISYSKKSLIVLKDARNQFLRFLAKKGESKVELASKDEQSNSVLQLHAGNGSTLLLSKYKGNKVYLNLDAKELSCSIVVESNGKVLSKIELTDDIANTTVGQIIDNYGASSTKSSNLDWLDTKDELDSVFYNTTNQAPGGNDNENEDEKDDKESIVHLFHVNDGLCILIRDNNKNVLIDTGEVGTCFALGIIDYLHSVGVHRLDAIVLTHFHSEHAGCLPNFLDNFEVGKVYGKVPNWNLMPKLEYKDSNTKEVYDDCKQALDRYNIEFITPYDGVLLNFSEISSLTLYNSECVDYSDYNNLSYALVYEFGDNRIYIGGDVTKSVELDLAKVLPKCDYYIASNHAEGDSNTSEILKATSPKAIFIPTYSTNSPEKLSTVSRLKLHCDYVYSTSDNGNITFTMNQKSARHSAMSSV